MLWHELCNCGGYWTAQETKERLNLMARADYSNIANKNPDDDDDGMMDDGVDDVMSMFCSLNIVSNFIHNQ